MERRERLVVAPRLLQYEVEAPSCSVSSQDGVVNIDDVTKIVDTGSSIDRAAEAVNRLSLYVGVVVARK